MPKLSIYLPEETAVQARERSRPDQQDPREKTGESAAIRTSLERYFALLQIGRRELRRLFGPEECAVIVAATNGALELTPSLIPVSPQCVVDALHLEGDRIVGCDGLVMEQERLARIDYPRFREKLQGLTPDQAFAFVDACERFWGHPDTARHERLFEERQSGEKQSEQGEGE